MRGYFLFGSGDSRDYKIGIERCPTYPVAQRVVEKTTVPGRSGDLVFDTGAYANVVQEYEIYFNAKQMGLSPTAGWLAQWLLSGQGYQRLEDSYRPDSYRMALFTGPLDIDNWMNLYGRVTLEFDCQPQRWLKNGQLPVDIQSGQSLINTWQPAKPLIQVTGTGDGTLVVGGSTISISDMTGTITLDSETEDAYSGTENLNDNVQVNGGYPILQNGETAVSFSGGITAVQITPRWWSL